VPDGSDVEHEYAALVEVVVCAVEEPLPAGKAEQVVNALVGADDGVKSGVELEAGHIGQVQRGSLGELLPGNSQHARRYIKAAHLVGACE
jgi:hypothetical protein